MADALAEWGNTRAALQVIYWLYEDHKKVAKPQHCRWVFEGLIWAGHLEEAAKFLGFLRRHGHPACAPMARRLSREAQKSGFTELALRLQGVQTATQLHTFAGRA